MVAREVCRVVLRKIWKRALWPSEISWGMAEPLLCVGAHVVVELPRTRSLEYDTYPLQHCLCSTFSWSTANRPQSHVYCSDISSAWNRSEKSLFKIPRRYWACGASIRGGELSDKISMHSTNIIRDCNREVAKFILAHARNVAASNHLSIAA